MGGLFCFSIRIMTAVLVGTLVLPCAQCNDCAHAGGREASFHIHLFGQYLGPHVHTHDRGRHVHDSFPHAGFDGLTRACRFLSGFPAVRSPGAVPGHLCGPGPERRALSVGSRKLFAGASVQEEGCCGPSMEEGEEALARISRFESRAPEGVPTVCRAAHPRRLPFLVFIFLLSNIPPPAI